MVLDISTCNGEPEVDKVVESSDAVRVTVVSEVQKGVGPACADYVQLDLKNPLKGRAVIDGSTGEEAVVNSALS